MEENYPQQIHSFAATEMQKRFILYVDLLGFKNKVNELDESSQKLIIDFYNFLHANLKGDGGIFQTSPISYNILPGTSFFSDSVICSYPVDQTVNCGMPS